MNFLKTGIWLIDAPYCPLIMKKMKKIGRAILKKNKKPHFLTLIQDYLFYNRVLNLPAKNEKNT